MPNKIHEGRNIKRFREMLGIKQEALAMELGDDWTQKKISLLEQKESVEPLLLQQVADALKIPAEVFKSFDEEQAVNIISNTINNHDQSAVIQYNPVFNPVEKWLEALEEIKKLYSALLEEKDARIRLLEKMMNG
ncbi:MAG TPA: helix-turn-helix transcriptional regulator [Niabella sp.]